MPVRVQVQRLNDRIERTSPLPAQPSLDSFFGLAVVFWFKSTIRATPALIQLRLEWKVRGAGHDGFLRRWLLCFSLRFSLRRALHECVASDAANSWKKVTACEDARDADAVVADDFFRLLSVRVKM